MLFYVNTYFDEDMRLYSATPSATPSPLSYKILQQNSITDVEYLALKKQDIKLMKSVVVAPY